MAPKPGQIGTEQRQVASFATREPKSFEQDEKVKFANSFSGLLKDVLNHPEHSDMEETNKWLVKALEYNVFNRGKYIRGFTTVHAYRQLVKNASEADIEKSYKLGWFIEMLRGALDIGTELMEEDKIPSPRGEKSLAWHKVGDMGAAGFNDSVLIGSAVYYLLKQHFSDLECYIPILNTFHHLGMKRTFGETLEKRTRVTGSQMRQMHMGRYETIVKYKTSSFSFYLPVALAMQFAGIKEESAYKEAEAVLNKIGLLYQMTRDAQRAFYLDDPRFKHDTIAGVSTWPIFRSLELASPTQLEIIKKFYGAGKNSDEELAASTIRDLYLDLGLPKVFATESESLRNEILDDIGNLEDGRLPKKLFLDMLLHISESSESF